MRRAPGLWLVVALALILPSVGAAQPPANRPQHLEWFRELGLGLFIHWSIDSQIGSVISHSLVGADTGYLERFFNPLRTFNPTKYNPRDWAVLAKLAGMKYVVFTTKHHSGFAMYDTRTTSFSITSTPYGKDVTAELVKAFREQGLRSDSISHLTTSITCTRRARSSRERRSRASHRRKCRGCSITIARRFESCSPTRRS
jgi:hypothetical protein